MEMLIKVHDSVDEFKNGDVLVFDNKTKSFKTVNINDVVQEQLKSFEFEKQEVKNEYKIAKERFNTSLGRFETLTNRLITALSGKTTQDIEEEAK